MKPDRLTPFGVEVKKRLLDLGLTQKEFCEQNNIPTNRFSEILYGKRAANDYRREIEIALGIRRSA
ncbi:MAG: Rha family transcriptional regulator [Desulfitobacteriaceae bacterium]|nr:Rha family transcriptional regulator [Desulfitobacteriaceae bacterium]